MSKRKCPEDEKQISDDAKSKIKRIEEIPDEIIIFYDAKMDPQDLQSLQESVWKLRTKINEIIQYPPILVGDVYVAENVALVKKVLSPTNNKSSLELRMHLANEECKNWIGERYSKLKCVPSDAFVPYSVFLGKKEGDVMEYKMGDQTLILTCNQLKYGGVRIEDAISTILKGLVKETSSGGKDPQFYTQALDNYVNSHLNE
jgi:hypothetical protein